MSRDSNDEKFSVSGKTGLNFDLILGESGERVAYFVFQSKKITTINYRTGSNDVSY